MRKAHDGGGQAALLAVELADFHFGVQFGMVCIDAGQGDGGVQQGERMALVITPIWARPI